MTQLQAGQRLPLSDLGLGHSLTVTVECDLSGTDITAFGLNDGQLSDDRYMVFYNQPQSPEGALRLAAPGTFSLNLDDLPASVTEVYLTATHDSQPVSRAGTLRVTVDGQVNFDAKPHLKDEKAVMLVRFYRHGGAWRLATVAQGFNGGLAALVQHFGGEVAEEDSAPAAPAVSLVKERQKVLLDKAERQQPGLVSLIKQASVSLEKRGLGEARYRVNLVLDISGSMSGEYRSGAVQRLAERALALATRLDDDGEVEMYLFGQQAHRRGTLSLDNVSGFVDRLNVQLEGGTDYGGVMEYVLTDARAAGHALPTLVLFITDGGTSGRERVVNLIQQASREPIFWKFMGIDQSASAGGMFGGMMRRMAEEGFGFLEQLDDLQGRTVDNADFFKVGAQINLPDDQLFDLLVNELDTWQRDARSVGVLR